MKIIYLLLLFSILSCTAIYSQSFKYFNVVHEHSARITLQHKSDTLVLPIFRDNDSVSFDEYANLLFANANIFLDSLYSTIAKLPEDIKKIFEHKFFMTYKLNLKGEFGNINFYKKTDDFLITEEQFLKVYDAIRNIKFKPVNKTGIVINEYLSYTFPIYSGSEYWSKYNKP